MVLALASGIAAWVATIVALLQHKARWLVCSAVAYAIQGRKPDGMYVPVYTVS